MASTVPYSSTTGDVLTAARWNTHTTAIAELQTVTGCDGTNNMAVPGTFSVVGASTLTGATNVAGAFSVATSKCTISPAGVAYFDSTLSALGNFWVGHATEATALFDVVAASGNLRVGTAAATKFAIAGASGNTDIEGTLSVGSANQLTVSAAGLLATSGSILSSSATAASGYSAGAGGAVAQITNRSTGVTLSKPCGAITTDATSLAAAAFATFTVTNTLVAATDTVVVSLKTPSVTGLSIPYVTTTAAGSFQITMHNIHASTADTSASVINFCVIKAVVS